MYQPTDLKKGTVCQIDGKPYRGFNQLQDDFPADFKEQLASYLKQGQALQPTARYNQNRR